MKTTVIYHSADFDGIFCREIAKHFLPDAELIGWDYGDPLVPMPSGQFYILDLSPECVEGLTACGAWLHPEAQRCIWIDHHKSAIDKFGQSAPGYRIDGVAACRLAWQWFSIAQHNAQNATNEALQVPLPNKEAFINRTVCEPLVVRLAGEYADLFQHGLRSQDISENLWDLLLVPMANACGFRVADLTALIKTEAAQTQLRTDLDQVMEERDTLDRNHLATINALKSDLAAAREQIAHMAENLKASGEGRQA